MLPPTPLTPPDAPDDAGSAEPRAGAIPAGARCATHEGRPAHAICDRCGSFACAPCTLVLASGESLCAACEAKEGGTLAWERRRELGVFRALVATVLGVLLRPAAFFAQRSREKALWPTLLLGMGLHVYGTICQMAVNLAFGDRIRADVAQNPIARQLGWLPSDESFVVDALISPLTFLLWLGCVSSLWWIGLRAVGGLQRPFHVVVRALCYAQAVAVLVPLIAPLAHAGPLGAGFGLAFAGWGLGIQIVAVTRMQGVPLRRGLMAFVVWAALAGCLVCLGGGAALWALASQIRIPNV